MSSVNKVILIGRLGQNPEMRATGNGTSVATLSVATSERFKKDGQMQEKTEWHRVVVWGKTAESCAAYLQKGREVYVEGRLQTRSWEKSDGVTQYSTEIIAEAVKFLGSKRESTPSQEPENEPIGSTYGSLDDIPF